MLPINWTFQSASSSFQAVQAMYEHYLCMFNQFRSCSINFGHVQSISIQALPGIENPHPHIQGECTRTFTPGLLPRALHRRLRLPGLLCRTHPAQQAERLHVHTRGPLVGHRHHDDGRVRWHDTEDLYGHAGGVRLRLDGRIDYSPARPGHRQQLRSLLLAHAGQGQTAQEKAQGASGRSRSAKRGSQEPARTPWLPRWSGAEVQLVQEPRKCAW